MKDNKINYIGLLARLLEIIHVKSSLPSKYLIERNQNLGRIVIIINNNGAIIFYFIKK